jgi:serine/threonine protein kinase
VVLKEYRDTNQDIRASFDNEVDLYCCLQDSAYGHIVRYYGSFQRQGKLTIVLEFALGGNLLNYFEKTPPPKTVSQRRDFWTSLFDLLRGLCATHDLNSTEEPGDRWLLKGYVYGKLSCIPVDTSSSPSRPYQPPGSTKTSAHKTSWS